MVNRPDSFDPATPAGTASPRDGDNQLRQIKEYTQNGYNDLTALDRDAVGRQTHPVFTTRLTGPVTGAVGDVTPAAGTFTSISTNGTVTVGDYVFTVDLVNGHITISTGGTNLFRVLDDGSALVAGDVTAMATIT